MIEKNVQKWQKRQSCISAAGGLLLALAMWHLSADAATWYAAADGNSTNGTYASPWSVPFSVTNANSYLQPGDTVLFKAGTFTCTDYTDAYVSSNILYFSKSGAVGNPITYRSETLWGFTFDGGLIVPYETHDLVFQYLHINSSTTLQGRSQPSLTNAWQYPYGFNIYGSNVTLLHNLIENTGEPGIGYWKLGSGKQVFGNIVRFIGMNDWSTASGIIWNGARRGAAIYTENLYGPAVFSGNIIYHNYTECYSIKQSLVGFNVTNNILEGGSTEALNLENEHTPTPGINIVNNYIWAGRAGCVGMRLGYYGGLTNHNDSFGNSNGFVFGNVVVAAQKGLFVDCHWKSITVQSNQIVRLGLPGDGGSGSEWEYNLFELEWSPPTNSPVYTLSGNSYFSATNSTFNFMYWGTHAGWSDWQTLSGETGSQITYAMPATNLVRAFQPSADSNFVHVVVYNWESNTTATVDLEAWFQVGDRLKIYDAQNIPVAYTNIVYAGGAVTLDLTLTNRAAMSGEFTAPAIPWTGFDPRFRAFVLVKINTGSGVLYGDVDSDGSVTAYDAALAARHAVGYTDADFKNAAAADVDNIPGISAYDAALIAQRAVGLISRFPVEP